MAHRSTFQICTFMRFLKSTCNDLLPTGACFSLFLLYFTIKSLCNLSRKPTQRCGATFACFMRPTKTTRATTTLSAQLDLRSHAQPLRQTSTSTTLPLKVLAARTDPSRASCPRQKQQQHHQMTKQPPWCLRRATVALQLSTALVALMLLPNRPRTLLRPYRLVLHQ